MAASVAGAASSLLRPVPSAAYIHLPFCRRRCFYCDFPIQVVGDRRTSADAAAERYVALLLREMRATPAAGADEEALKSLYFGGGTPSLTPPPLLATLIKEVRERYGLDADAECTLEMDPGTFDAARLEAYLDAGVTRVSLGIQSFDAAQLTAAGRAHTLEDAENALDLVLDPLRCPGLSVSIDLIGGLPEQSRESWERSLDLATTCGAHHVSVYDLQLEANTKFSRLDQLGKLRLPEEETAAQMFRDASTRLGAAGFEHYEVSSYARPGHRGRHNGAYWRNEPFWAWGLGSTSHVNERRLSRPRTMKGYEDWVGSLEAMGWKHTLVKDAVHEPFGTMEELQTRLMLALRTDGGVDLSAIRGAYTESRGGLSLGAAAAEACTAAARALPHEWLELEDDTVRLSDPEGLLFSNSAISSILAELEDRWEDEDNGGS